MERLNIDDVLEPAAPNAARAPRISRLTLSGQDIRVGIWPGEEKHTPLLIFNGIGARLELLAPLVSRLAAHREVIVFDVPGTGESPAPLLPYRMWMLARLTARLLDELGRDRVDAMGISWGGTIAQQFAVQHAKRCGKLILAATTPGALMVPGDLRVLLRMASPRRYNDAAYMQSHFGDLYSTLR